MTGDSIGDGLRDTLGDPLDAQAFDASWVAIERTRRLKGRRRDVARGVAGTVLIGLAITVGAVTLFRGTPAALRPVDGHFETLSSPGADRALRLDDGSVVALDDDAHGEVVVNDGRRFVFLLRSGRGRFEITPGGPRAWSIDAGAARVDVLGTVFEVDRRDDVVVVRVERGRVVVFSALLPTGRRVLRAGGVAVIPTLPARVADEPRLASGGAPRILRRRPAPKADVAGARPGDGPTGPSPLGGLGLEAVELDGQNDPEGTEKPTSPPFTSGNHAAGAGPISPPTPEAGPTATPEDAAPAPVGSDDPVAPWRVGLRGASLARNHFGGRGPWLFGGEIAVRVGPLDIGTTGLTGRRDAEPGRVRFGIVSALLRWRPPVSLSTGQLTLEPSLRAEVGWTGFRSRATESTDVGRSARALYAAAAAEIETRWQLPSGPALTLRFGGGYATGLIAKSTGEEPDAIGTTTGWLLDMSLGLDFDL